MSHKRLTSDERRTDLLTITMQLICEGHYHELTRETIAEACGVSPSLVNHYYPNVKHLIAEALNLTCMAGRPHAVVIGLQVKNKYALRLSLEVRHAAINEVLL